LLNFACVFIGTKAASLNNS